MAEFEFVPPPEAPVFRPTEDEFADTLAYINKIRPIAEQTGICRIIPPRDWQPPFAVDVDNLRFTPRIQRLNELEAHTRIKLNFLDQIAKFWELQGSSLKIPLVEGKALDLYTLHCEVQTEGGPELVSQNRRWNRIAQRMGFPTSKHHLSFTLKHHYEKILMPYDIFKAGKVSGEAEDDEKKPEVKREDVAGSGVRMAGGGGGGSASRRTQRTQETTLDHDTVQELAEQGGNNKELKRLQFYGAGPKMSGYQESAKNKPRAKKIMYDVDPLARYVCHVCTRGDSEESMLLCDGCDDSYHTFCLNPPLVEIPKGDWRCPQCVAAEVEKPQEAFGFEQAQKEYTLQTFGEMADQFKSDYFNMPVHMVPTQTAEKEFWRIVSSIDEDVVVEYGADLHSMDHGSGFPTKDSKNLSKEDEEYVSSGWNLNNIAILDNSILAHIKANISGMKVPWMYVGMCFSTFCWHNEDHWSYSINYMHWGEPKTWYGCSGLRAEQFEAAMRAAAPELFKAQPDLLHQLVTTMNPNILMAAGVPIFRTDQHAGEFVITFPRAYHTGFNQGFNFAEAVNFAPPDWLAIGRECVAHYSQLRRFCVFSHDELVCSMSLEPDKLSLMVASATYQDMLKMIDTERKQRAEMLEKGVRKAEREAFELLPDDERQCDYCKTTCFLSALTCPCDKRLVCLRHHERLCDCPPANHVLRYRYTLQELPEMLQSLKVRVECFDQWILKVKNGLEATGDQRLSLEDLKSLLHEAEAKRFPESELISSLAMVIEEATKCSMVAQQLASKKVRTRTRHQGDKKYRLSVDELELFYEHIEQLACKIPEQKEMKQLVDQVQEFQRRAVKLMEPELPPPASEIQECVDLGSELDIELPEIMELKQRLSHAHWLEEVEEGLAGKRRLSLDGIGRLVQTGVTLPPYHVVERAMGELQGMLQAGQQHEERAKLALNARPVQGLPELEALLSESEKVPASLPNVEALREAVKKAHDWMDRVAALTDKKEHPTLEVVESLVVRGQPLPVLLPDLSRLENLVNATKAWKERASRTFLRRNTLFSLLEVLSPRKDVSIYQSRSRRRRAKEEQGSTDLSAENTGTVAEVVDAYRAAENREIDLMRGLRTNNTQKRETDNKDSRYCLCRQPLRGHMMQCELCKDFFHASCVPPVKPSSSGAGGSKSRASGSDAAGGGGAAEGAKFLCPLCLRSRRPRLEVILSLLVSLQKLSLRLPEGIALQCLTERAMRWQDRARQVLSSEDLSSALSQLSSSTQEPSYRDRAEKVISRELLQKRHSESSLSATEADSDNSRDTSVSSSSHRPDSQEPPAGFSSSEHAYSSAFKQTPTTPSRRPRKAVLSPRRTGTPPPPPPPPPGPGGSAGPLPADRLGQLERLMMEGDLLEVSLEETAQLWRLLRTARPPQEVSFPNIDIVKMEDSGARRKTPGPVRKKRVPGGSEASPGAAGRPVKRLKVKVKPHEEEATPAGSGHRSGSPSTPGAKRTQRTPTSAGVKRKIGSKEKKTGVRRGAPKKAQHQRKASTDSGEDEIKHYAEDCAATPCQKPHGSCINWIGCDECEQWYHYICVGLPKNYQVTEDMVYICPRCQGDANARSDEDVSAAAGSSSALGGGGGGGGSSLLDLAAAAQVEDGASALLSLASGLGSPPPPPPAAPQQPPVLTEIKQDPDQPEEACV